MSSDGINCSDQGAPYCDFPEEIIFTIRVRCENWEDTDFNAAHTRVALSGTTYISKNIDQT